ncbi:unnamed protein product (mitochondrion) [Plasmodiophora brassicae]|uniref:Methyltransferase type 11 domain-containing protein n=1 Tax=Plasmodiophora brassicae TaxID=37360 RepID=A0A3P3YG32_PLABS|nr:unnamed protein product [Plasmodiophora brassicae]
MATIAGHVIRTKMALTIERRRRPVAAVPKKGWPRRGSGDAIHGGRRPRCLIGRSSACRWSGPNPAASTITCAMRSRDVWLIVSRISNDRFQREVQNLVQVDNTLRVVQHNRESQPERIENGPKLHHICADEEFLPFQPASVDMVLSSLSLHWVNELESTLAQVRQCLKPDGAFLGAILGGKTLQELRSAFAIADQERTGGVSPHISPMISPSDAGALLQHAGFVLPTIDTDIIVCQYPDMFTLMEHLEAMGANNCAVSRRPFVSRDVFTAAASAYNALYTDNEGLVRATFQVVYMIGWAPDDTKQPQPLRRGSAKASLKDLAE